MTRLTILFALVILFKENCGQHQTFIKNGIFKVPDNIYWVRVVAVGGGGGGTNGHMPGGAGGYVKCKTLQVTPNQEYGIVVGKGGSGAITKINSNAIEGCTSGSRSQFADLVAAEGGEGCGSTITGNNGGTGSGAACWGGRGGRCISEGMGGRGGSGGSNGGDSSDGFNGGKGQGQEYLNCLATAKRVWLTVGDGGQAVDANCKDQMHCWGAGSGGGGVNVNGQGQAAYDGQAANPKLAGEGGKGYGSGGGGGGYQVIGGIHYSFGGGNGIDGLVHVEWN